MLNIFYVFFVKKSFLQKNVEKEIKINLMQKSSLFFYLKYMALALLFPLVAGLYTLEFFHFGNTFELRHLFIVALLLGLSIGLFIAFRYQYYATNAVEHFQIFASSISLMLILMPLFMSLTNRLFAFEPIRQEQVELFKVEAIISDRFGILVGEEIKPDVYYIFFIRDGELQRVKSDSPVFVDKQKGDMIDIPVLKGLWGYELVVW